MFRVGIFDAPVHGLAAALLILSLLAGCAAPPPLPSIAPWSAGQLIALDPPDNSDPLLDMVAIFARRQGDLLEMRIDWLDISDVPSTDLLIYLDLRPTGSDDPLDAYLWIPACGELAVDSNSGRPIPGASLRVLRDAENDSIQLQVRLPGQPGYPARLQVFSSPSAAYAAAHPNAYDDFTPVLSLDRPAPAPIPIILGFSNAYPAYTPLTALRRWSGAHTGPLGGSHGLRYLLQGARRTSTPIAFLDGLTPEALSALDYAGALPQVQSLAQDGLLMLPKPPDAATGEWAILTRAGQAQALQTFGLQSAQTHLPAPPVRVPASQVDKQGLTLAARTAIVHSLDATSGAPTILGGSLPESEWGEPGLAEAGMKYIQNHAWIKVLGPSELKRISTSSLPQAENDPQEALPSEMQEAFRRAPNNALKTAALQAARSLAAPVYPPAPDLSNLRRAYLPDVVALLDAAAWADAPVAIQRCDQPASSGQLDCIWANERFYLQFDPSGGLRFAFWKGPNGVHQFIGPSSQLITGLSDPATWRTADGEWADPAVLPGAFVTETPLLPRFDLYGISFSDGEASNYAYSYRVYGDVLEILVPKTVPTNLPVLLDPWQRFSPGWSRRYQLAANELNGYSPTPAAFQSTQPSTDAARKQWRWQAPGLTLDISTPSSGQWASFLDAQPFFARAEDPNQDYPAGYRLPFPLAVLSLPAAPGESSARTIITLSLSASDILNPENP